VTCISALQATDRALTSVSGVAIAGLALEGYRNGHLGHPTSFPHEDTGVPVEFTVDTNVLIRVMQAAVDIRKMPKLLAVRRDTYCDGRHRASRMVEIIKKTVTDV
jgi:hypothetical protein